MEIKQCVNHYILGVSLILGLVLNVAYADDVLSFSSGDEPKILVELYTSEGCNSCPPAEAALNALLRQDALWRTYIPVAFHVDYWDYIGWPDPYAHAAHGGRQSQYAKSLGHRTVYTPAFMVNGKPWRRGFLNRSLPEQGLTGGTLEVHVSDGMIKARYLPVESSSKPLILHVAVLGMGLRSHIKAGENRGRTAEHEFVSIGYKTAVTENNSWKIEFPRLHFKDAKDHALAVWVSRGQDPAPLQAVGGVLPVSVSSLID